MPKVLVTGGLGFIGNHLVKALLDKDFDVTVIDCAEEDPKLFDATDVRLIHGSSLDRVLMRFELKRAEMCFHLAAIASVVVCNQDWMFAHQVNVGSFNLLLDILKVDQLDLKLVYASSAAVYGNQTVSCFHENLLPRPCSSYAADKYSNELYAYVLNENYHIPSVGLRLFNVYGIGQKQDSPYSGVITQFHHRLAHDEPLTIHGDGKQTRDFIYIDDVVNAFVTAALRSSNGAEIFNVCSGTGVSILELAHIMAELIGKKADFHYAPSRVGDIRHAIGSTQKMVDELHAQAKTNLREGLTLLIEHDLTPDTSLSARF